MVLAYNHAGSVWLVSRQKAVFWGPRVGWTRSLIFHLGPLSAWSEPLLWLLCLSSILVGWLGWPNCPTKAWRIAPGLEVSSPDYVLTVEAGLV